MDNRDTVVVNGITYIKETDIVDSSTDGLSYCVVRTDRAGVFAGWIDRSDASANRTIYDSRRLWAWAGAASLSQLATTGTTKPDSCKFAVVVREEDLLGIIEVIPCSNEAKDSIASVELWKV